MNIRFTRPKPLVAWVAAAALLCRSLALGSATAEAPKSCESPYEAMGRRHVRAETLDPELKKGKFLLKDQPGYRDDAFYIGITNDESHDGAHHYYLVAGGKRFDGAPLFLRPKLGKGNLGTRGVLFQIPVPPEALQEIQAGLAAGSLPRGVSCLHALCRVLQSAQIQIEGTDRAVRSKVVSASLVEGKITFRGKPLDREEMRVWESAKGEIEHYLKTAGKVDRDQILGVSTMAIMAVVLVGAVGEIARSLVVTFLVADPPRR